MAKGVIYKYTFPDGKVYIGQTRRNPAIRHKEHFDEKIGPGNKAFWEAYKRLGEPIYEVVETIEMENVGDLIQVLNQLETKYIGKYKSSDPKYGYNRMGYATVSFGIREKINSIYVQLLNTMLAEKKRLFKEVEIKVETSQAFTSDEEALFQDYFVRNMFYRGRSIKDYNAIEYENLLEFALFAMEEDIKNYVCAYINENTAYLLDNYTDDQTIFQIDDNGEIVGKFFTQVDAAMALRVKSANNISNVLRGKQKKAYGYRWVYAKDYKK